jgi:hypothetical protein
MGKPTNMNGGARQRRVHVLPRRSGVAGLPGGTEGVWTFDHRSNTHLRAFYLEPLFEAAIDQRCFTRFRAQSASKHRRRSTPYPDLS